MQITLRDVAEHSGYSITTVSRALSGYNDVNQKTREHILSVADRLGYQPNLVARQLRSRSTQTLGFVMPYGGADDDFFGVLLKGISYAAAQQSYDLLISTQLPGDDLLAAYRRMVGGRRVDGVILARTQRNDPRIRYLQKQGHPFVVSGRLTPDQVSDFPYIDVDSEAGLHQMTTHFAACGHKAIGLILPPEELAFTSYRLRGYQRGLQAAGLPYMPERVVTGDMTRAGGYAAANKLLAQAPGLTAIIACNDLMALGVMDAVRGRGLRVGEDIAVGGFDDIPPAEHAHPALTTVRQPIFEIGRRLTDLLLQVIRGETPPETHFLLKPELIIRASSGHERR